MKPKDPARHKELKTLVQKRLRRDKQKELEDLCDELETTNQRGNMRCLFRTANSIIQTFRSRLHSIQTASGRNVTEPEEIADRWREYCEEVYNDEDTPEIDQQFEREPPPLKAEVARAIKLPMVKVQVWMVFQWNLSKEGSNGTRQNVSNLCGTVGNRRMAGRLGRLYFHHHSKEGRPQAMHYTGQLR